MIFAFEKLLAPAKYRVHLHTEGAVMRIVKWWKAQPTCFPPRPDYHQDVLNLLSPSLSSLLFGVCAFEKSPLPVKYWVVGTFIQMYCHVKGRKESSSNLFLFSVPVQTQRDQTTKVRKSPFRGERLVFGNTITNFN